MAFKDAMQWIKRASFVYALGVWTMIGSYAFFKYTGRLPDVTVTKEEEQVEKPEDSYEVVYETAHNKTVITYRKDFVPLSTKISNFLQWFSGKPSTGDRDE